MPANKGPYYGENSSEIIRTFIRLGNFDRLWSHPTHLWPGGWNTTAFWAKNIHMVEYNPDDTFNPPTVDGDTNPSYHEPSGPNYATAAYAPNPATPGRTVAGAGTARDYSIETKWVDANRHHAVYESGWPTNLGIDVVLKVHQWSLNWNNFDDFHIVEIQLTNTGNVDIDCDGTVERTNNEIKCLALYIGGEVAMSALVNTAGTRSSHWGGGRHSGFVGDADPTGAPWAIHAVYPGEGTDGLGNFGNNSGRLKYYTDIWSTWTLLGAKQGTDPVAGATKNLIWGIHPVGEGAQRGWNFTSGDAIGLAAGRTNPKNLHTAAIGTFYQDGGKSRDQALFDLNPNSNYFDSGTAGDPTTFVAKASPTAPPNGTRQRLSLDAGAAAFEKTVFEPGWTIGYSSQQNFDADSYAGFGPWGLAVGETATIYIAQGAGFRLQGAVNAMQAARYVYANGLTLPIDYPAVPQIQVGNTLNKTVKISWDNASTNHANFGGYKIYRADLARRIDYLDEGIRVVDDYWMQMTPSPTVDDQFKQEVNPLYNPANATGRGAPDAWGPYHLVKVIPSTDLAQYADAADPNFQYAWEDPSIELGFKYWYYVAAYTSTSYDLGPTWVSYPGTNPATSTFIETSNINRNGATGTWQNTYPFAFRNPFYPTGDGAGLAAMGAGFTVQSALADPNVLASGGASIGVKPNPYKKKALFDSASDPADHKVVFYNLPPRAKITILDVSGQIIEEIRFESNDPNNGSVFWDLFSMNGAEVASGLYIYVVDYEVTRSTRVETAQHVGYLSILR
jgi:hypothetical protein